MPYGEIIAVCSQIHTKHIHTLFGQNVELLNVKLAVHIVTTGLQRVTRRLRRSTSVSGVTVSGVSVSDVTVSGVTVSCH